MEPIEAFSKITGFWPNSFKPLEMWRSVALEELAKWTPEERANIRTSVERVIGARKSVDMEILRRARSAPGTRHGFTQAVSNSEAEWLTSLGLMDCYNRQHIADRVMISRLIRCMILTPGWQGRLERQAGSAKDFHDWQRIENLVHAAETAVTSRGEGKWRKVCYPTDRDGWSAPKELLEIFLPEAPTKQSEIERIAGLKKISAIADRHGGLKAGNHGNIYHSPEYQQYLADYTARTGMPPG